MFIFIILLACWSSCTASPFDFFPQLMDTLTGEHYAAADSICDQISATYPGHPAYYYGRATIAYAHIRDFEDTLGRGAMIALADSCTATCARMQAHSARERAELAYLRGSALAIQGFLCKYEGRILPGIKFLIAAKGAFDDAITADSTFYDAYLGRGAYRYGVARYAHLLKWLPMIPSAASGWQDLWLAIEKSRFSKYAVFTSVVWFALQDGKYALVDSLCQVGLARFPNSRSFLWPTLALAEKQHRWRDAEATARELLRQYQNLRDNNGYEVIGLNWRLMLCADSLGRPADAETYARAGISALRTPDVEKKRRDKLEQMQERLGQAIQTQGSKGE
jgi:hypothetical protein